MKSLSEVKRIISENKKELERRFNIQHIGVFGSFVNDRQSLKSDIDILVDFKEPVDFFDFLELEEHLSELLAMRVDLVMKSALRPKIGERILREVIYV